MVFADSRIMQQALDQGYISHKLIKIDNKFEHRIEPIHELFGGLRGIFDNLEEGYLTSLKRLLSV